MAEVVYVVSLRIPLPNPLLLPMLVGIGALVFLITGRVFRLEFLSEARAMLATTMTAR